MQRRHPLPRLWLMTDERQGDALWPAIDALPRGSGIVVRHHNLAGSERRDLAKKVRKAAKRRRLAVILAGTEKETIAVAADGFHRRSAHIGAARLIRTIAVHNPRELALAHRIDADLVFLSPVYPTRSHPGGRALGRVRFGLLARRSRIPIIVLGGMTAKRARSLRGFGIYGWAAIGELTPDGA